MRPTFFMPWLLGPFPVGFKPRSNTHNSNPEQSGSSRIQLTKSSAVQLHGMLYNVKLDRPGSVYHTCRGYVESKVCVTDLFLFVHVRLL